MSHNKKFAIFTTVRDLEDIPFALALGKSLRILKAHTSADLNCVCSQELAANPTLHQLTDTWTKLYVNAPKDQHYLNVLTGHIYTNYTAVMYVDPHTVFFNSPISLFNAPLPAAFFNSIYSSYMIKMYSDILSTRTGDTSKLGKTDPKNPDYTMGHMHVYGQLKNNYSINYDIMRQAVQGVYAGYLPQPLAEPEQYDDIIDPESQVRALDSQFMVFQPDSDFYIFVRDIISSTPMVKPYLVGSLTDIQIMTMSLAYYDSCLAQGRKLPMWKNLVHNYRVPTQLVQMSGNSKITDGRVRIGIKPKVIYRKDTIEGLITSQLLIYGVEADLDLAKLVCSMSQLDDTRLADMAPSIEHVTYVNREHEEESKK